MVAVVSLTLRSSLRAFLPPGALPPLPTPRLLSLLWNLEFLCVCPQRTGAAQESWGPATRLPSDVPP